MQHFVHHRSVTGEEIVNDNDWMQVSRNDFHYYRIGPDYHDISLRSPRSTSGAHRQSNTYALDPAPAVQEFRRDSFLVLPTFKDRKHWDGGFKHDLLDIQTGSDTIDEVSTDFEEDWLHETSNPFSKRGEMSVTASRGDL